MKKAVYYLLDVFTKEKYQGNPLAIFPDTRWIPESSMQSIAAELNLSETVFLHPARKTGVFPMRIFTPAMELPVAGHPTIGTGFYLSRELDHPANGTLNIKLAQKIGIVPVTVTFKDNLPLNTRMEFPKPSFGVEMENRRLMADLLGLTADDLLDLPIQVVSCGVPFIILPIKGLESIKKIQFRVDLWNKHRKDLAPYFIYVFTPQGETDGADLHGRMFAPQAGILEDPATGAANSPLAAYCLQYGIKEGPLVSEQGFEMGRPSFLHIEARKSGDEIVSVSVGGDCVFVGTGELFLD